MSINLNGLVKDYDPPGGIDLASTVDFDVSGIAWAAAEEIPCPQGDAFNVVPMDGSPYDTGFEPRALGDGFFATRCRLSDSKPYSSNMKVKGSTGSVEPSTASYDAGSYHDNVFEDGDIRWQHLPTPPSTPGYQTWAYQGARQNSTAYTVGQLVSSNSKIWRCLVAGTTAGSPPAGLGTTDYGGFLFDGSCGWSAQGSYLGAWSSTTAITGVVTNTGRTAIVPVFVTTTGGVLWMWDGCYGTWGTTGGSEPAWSVAADSAKYWVDNEVLWIRGTDLYGTLEGTNQRERLIITGWEAPADDGHELTIPNNNTDQQDIVLADKNAFEPQSGVDPESLGSDAESTSSWHDFGGSDLRIAPGESATIVYDAGTTSWSQLGGGGGGGSDLLLVGVG